jgi:hypothetical protein
MTETDDSMWLHMLSMTGPLASDAGSGFDVAFVTCARRAKAKATMIVPREKITARPNFCWGETWEFPEELEGEDHDDCVGDYVGACGELYGCVGSDYVFWGAASGWGC